MEAAADCAVDGSRAAWPRQEAGPGGVVADGGSSVGKVALDRSASGHLSQSVARARVVLGT
eukprot:scaffold91988_cov26-Tisochrysis_lutea.AAC.4